MKSKLGLSLALLLGLTPLCSQAGGGAEMAPAHRYEHSLHTISLAEAEALLAQKDVYFFDVNTLELWAEGYIPGAVYFNVDNWKTLLPEDKAARMVFYCANRLCNASEIAAHQVMKLGYTNVMQMHDGIYGWRLSGRSIEKP
ncbi:rhodanese-like domain-containing protein [Shewanella halotolerans]|uniref:rhodanese-like domain-containing protein n=1 Tax=Shewanella halotolerans TaxID=2864204 RepID=UPI001C65C0BD|nr:rhodanese-like domain-containing protein [Shewanella halotolerans]QYJ90367.1 rhodanese-like domain-containing protein [Shewanella halotolerans]